MKKLITIILILGSMNIFSAGQSNENSKKTTSGEVKRFKNLQDAAVDYAKVLQEVSNYGSREMLKTINKSVDEYVLAQKNDELTKKWEETNTMLLEQFDVSVQKVNERKELGDVIFLIKGYDEDALSKYLEKNVEQYAKANENGEVEIDIEKYIDIQYNYLKNTPKINLATSRVDFVKYNNEWKVIESK